MCNRSFGVFRLSVIGNVYASPVGAAGRVYLTDLDGTTLVLRHGPTLDVLAKNHLDDSFSASAAATAFSVDRHRIDEQASGGITE